MAGEYHVEVQSAAFGPHHEHTKRRECRSTCSSGMRREAAGTVASTRIHRGVGHNLSEIEGPSGLRNLGSDAHEMASPPSSEPRTPP